MEKWPATNKYYQMIQIFIRLCHICVILSIVLSICLILLRVGKEKKKKKHFVSGKCNQSVEFSLDSIMFN